MSCQYCVHLGNLTFNQTTCSTTSTYGLLLSHLELGHAHVAAHAEHDAEPEAC